MPSTDTDRSERIDYLIEQEERLNYLRAKKGLSDLYYFSKEMVETNDERKKMLVDHVHGEWSRWYHGSSKRLKMILVPRGTFKSTIFTVNNSIRKIVKNRNERILIANAVAENARGFLGEIKDHLEKNEKLKEYYGEFYDEKVMRSRYAWSENKIEVLGRDPGVREPTVVAAGVGGQLTSQHYSTIIWDDLVGEANIGTRDQAMKVIDWWKRTLSLLDPGGEGIIIGTRWSHFELYHYIMNDPQLSQLVDIFIRGAWRDDGELYFPEMLSEAKLREYKTIQGSYIFSAFYLNEPVDEDSALVKKSMLHTYGGTCEACNGEHMLPKEGHMAIFMAVDPAISQTTGADSTAILVVGVDLDGRWWVLEAKAGRFTTQRMIEEMFELYKRYGPHTVTIETIGQAQAILDPIREAEKTQGVFLPLKTVKTRAGQNKEARIRAVIGPRFERHMVYIRNDMIELLDQVARYPKSRYDDMVDALSDIAEIEFTPDTPLDERERNEEGNLLADNVRRVAEKQQGRGLVVDDVLGDFY